mmetsp:Transcript_22598/g.40684  ORF Transcript_22598/g.40684 Transcript_22598/m.40684 type:complete len:90 (+) Transcript_22598:3285-3554(+)
MCKLTDDCSVGLANLSSNLVAVLRQSYSGLWADSRLKKMTSSQLTTLLMYENTRSRILPSPTGGEAVIAVTMKRGNSNAHRPDPTSPGK